MTLIAILLLCGIAACATLVFLVETVVAFWLQDHERATTFTRKPIPIDSLARHLRKDEAA